VSGLRVAVAGAGLGGLCLAQGLARACVDVRVYERDAAPDVRRQRYRLHSVAPVLLAAPHLAVLVGSSRDERRDGVCDQ